MPHKVKTIDIHQRSKNLRHLDPGMGLKLGIFGFSRTKITAVRQVHMSLHLLQSKREDKTRVKPGKDHGRIGVAFVFACVVCKNPKTPKSSPWLATPLHGAV